MMDQKIARRNFLKMTAAAAAGTSLLNASALTGQTSLPAKRFLKSVQYGMLPKNLSDKEKFQLARRCGYTGIEDKPTKDLKAARERAQIAREAGCPIHGLVFGWWPPFTDTTPSVVQKSIDAMKNALRCAREMKAETVLLVPTRVTDNFSYADAYKRSQEYVHRLIPTAQETGVIIAVENVWNKFLLSPLEFARYLDELDSKYIRAYFDVGNVIIYGFAQHWIRTLGKRIIRIHLKDFKREGYKWTNLGEGDVNWPEVRKAFDEIKFSGWLTTELRGGDEAYLTDLSQRIDRLLSLKT